MAVFHDRILRGWEDRFEAGELHMVCLAIGGLTFCDCAACSLGGMNKNDEVWPLTKRVNRLGETGTFHPRLALTVVPLLSWEDRSVPGDVDSFLRKSFEDVAEAQREYIQLDTMFVHLGGREDAYPITRALEIAKEVLCDEESLETIYFAPGPS